MVGKVRIAGAGILYNNERILLAQRNPKSRFFGGFYSFIGGRLEDDEDPLQATRREIEEELGIAITDDHPHDKLGIITTPPFSPIRYETHFFAFPWQDEAAPTPITTELVDTRWETAGRWLELWKEGSLRIPPPVLHILRHAQQIPPSPALWEDLRGAAQGLDNGEKLHQIFFAPGLLMAPLETPTLPPAKHTNCYILGHGKGLVVDPAPTDEDEHRKLDELLEATKFQPTAAVITHHHHDHSAGALSFAKRWKVPLLAHPLAASRVEGAEASLQAGTILETDAENWQVIETPGHARGHICLLGEKSRSVIAGDMISTLSTILIDPPEGHMGTYLSSLKKLMALDIDALYPSHGPPAWQPKKTLQYFISHRMEREEKIFQALDQGKTQELDEIVAKAYADVDQALWFLAGRSAVAHLDHLEEQKRAQKVGDLQWQSLP